MYLITRKWCTSTSDGLAWTGRQSEQVHGCQQHLGQFVHDARGSLDHENISTTVGQRVDGLGSICTSAEQAQRWAHAFASIWTPTCFRILPSREAFFVDVVYRLVN